MTCKVNADTTNGLKLTSDTSGEIDLQTNGTTKVHMASDGKLGIGTTSPSSKLTVQDFGNDAALYVGGGLKMDDGPGNPWYLGKGILGSTGSEFLIGNGSNELLRIDQSGNLLCNSTSLGFANQRAVQIQTVSTGLISIQHLNTEASGSAYMWFTHNGGAIGSITQNGTTGISYNVNSDYRLKENVDYTFDATSRLKQLKPCRFNFKADTDRTVDGFIAHEVSDIVPEAVTGEKDAMMTEEYEVTPAVLDDDGNTVEEAVMGTREVPDYQGIDQSKLVPLLVKTIQELEARITALENN